MKHYKRKKFFYRFFMRQSPRSGAMFGLAWMICFGAILPLTPWIFLQIYPPMQTFSDTDIVLWRIFCCLFCGISIIIIYAYGFLTFVKNFYTILRNDLKKSRFWKIPAIVGALNWELACIFLLPASVLNKRRWLALVFLMCGLGLSLAGYILDNPLPKWWSLHVGLPFFLLLALSAMGKDKKFSWNFVYPFIVFVIFITSIILLDQCSQTHIESKRYELSAIGNKISEEDWKARNQTIRRMAKFRQQKTAIIPIMSGYGRYSNMDIFWLLYGLTAIPVAGVILSIVMLIKDFRGYRKTVLKKSLITALIALLLLGGALLPPQSEAYAGFFIVGLPLTILGPAEGFRWDWWVIITLLVWLNWFGICSFFTTGMKFLAGKNN